MKQFLLITLISLGLSIGLHAKQESHHNDTQAMSEKQIKKMDRRYNNHKTQKRNFRNKNDFQQRNHSTHQDRYKQGNNYNRSPYQEHHRGNIQRGYPNTKRGWVLAYRYDRASFYDNEGYHYGYFNRHGYYFENVFYRYDRYYSYRDRSRGRGLFDRRYYMPSNYRYYGFSR
ncbi:MAG: hypothetical protein Q9M39_07515 [Sulfurovum sp.]|nr:hypothetical protein [Sulfurovum sp.]